LGSAIAAMAAATLDPEKLLWVPGKKLISIPAREVSHVYVQPGDTICAMLHVSTNLGFGPGDMIRVNGMLYTVTRLVARNTIEIVRPEFWKALPRPKK
jgi:hypothetical protein